MKYILAIDQSTSSSKAFIVDEKGNIVKRASKAHQQYYPAPGRVEHDADEIWRNVNLIIDEVSSGVDRKDILALAITNQRETTVLWDRKTGEPVCKAIVWQDVRGEEACRELSYSHKIIHETTGLLLSPYYPAGKIRALFKEREDIRTRAENGEICIGTIDSYLIYRFTNGAVHTTDTTNGSRTQLMDLGTLKWSREMLELFEIPEYALPATIVHADSIFGYYRDIPIIGVLGDSHAALFGNGCHTAGMAKATFGTGSSVMMNVGTKPIISSNGLSASVAFSAGNKTFYALEGNVTCSGDTLVWLCDTLGLFKSPAEIEQLAAAAGKSDGVVMIPAFSGLGAPYFDSDARGIISGLNRGTTKANIAYAALESIAQQDADILEIMALESGYTVEKLFVDGGPTKNSLLMQLQADYAGCSLSCAKASELSALGAAYISGIKVGMYEDFASIAAVAEAAKEYSPRCSADERNYARNLWKRSINKAK